MNKFFLKAGRGTKLLQNENSSLKIDISSKSSSSVPDGNQILMILGNLLAPVNHIGIIKSKGLQIIVPPSSEYMIINMTDIDLELQLSLNWENHRIIYDPYLYEEEDHKNYDLEEFKNEHSIQDGYLDILTKWYSIKFTYPDFNLIYIRPGLGISLQMHAMREEHWETIQGHPIIIAGSKISYNTELNSHFDIPLGALHTVINPIKLNSSNLEWVVIKESYTGKFDEEDIIRVFNPNRYNTD